MSSSRAEDPSLNRVGAFSDGVFAFAITLLILSIRVPRPTDADAGLGLVLLLSEQWRSYLAYALSFMLVGINWTNHRIMFSTFVRGDHALIWLNLLYLMLAVAIIPLPTAVLGAWLGNSSHANEVAAAVFYGGTATVGAIIYSLVWWYGAYVAKLTRLTDQERRAHSKAWFPAPILTGALTAVAFLSPSLAVAGFVAVVFLYVLPVPRLIAMRRQRGP